MALPFILGLAIGAGAVIAYSKSDKLKQKACDLANKSKDLFDETKLKGEEVLSTVKRTVKARTSRDNEDELEEVIEKEPKKSLKETTTKEND